MRIVTRPDFDGIVCAVLLTAAVDVQTPIKWVEPSEIQKNRVPILATDIIANLPYADNCALWFDHHITNRIDKPFKGLFDLAPSAARLVFEYYASSLARDYSALVAAADKIDSAALSMDEVRRPQNHPWILLSMTIANRLKSDEVYWNLLVDLLRSQSLPRVLEQAQVKEKCRAVVTDNLRYEKLLKTHTRMLRHVSITDLRTVDDVPAGNRFLVYALNPEAFVSVRIRHAENDPQTVIINVGHSIFNPGCQVNVGRMLSACEGGGHRAVGSCSFCAHKTERYLSAIIDRLLENRAAVSE